jgi:periplasmic divalent cation tolerance protein
VVSDAADAASPVDVVVVTVSVPDEATGDRIAEALVAHRCAACVKRSGPVQSVYRWQCAVERDQEWLLSCVTTRDRVGELTARVRELHPYDVPEIIATAVTAGDPEYLDWVRRESTPD